MNPNTELLLKQLRKWIREGMLTKGNCVDELTFMCWCRDVAHGKEYGQIAYELMTAEQKKVFAYKKPGDVIGDVKIIAVFDVWFHEHNAVSKSKEPVAC